VARFGGDEFLVVLPSTHFAGSVTVAERIWRDVSKSSPLGPSAKVPSISAGVALYPSRDVRTKDALLRAADTALNQAKREGGNRICVFQQQGYLYTPDVNHDRPPERGGSAATSAERRLSDRPQRRGGTGSGSPGKGTP
jgi:predicted signal transduction protein with EAL and GGDEF domain